MKAKASRYFLPDGTDDDLLQEGRYGLLKAIRDYREGHDASFRYFAEGCIQRQIITAVKTATRGKHSPLNERVSIVVPEKEAKDRPHRQVIFDSDAAFMCPSALQPEEVMRRNEFLEKLCWLEFGLTHAEAWALAMTIAGYSYQEIAHERKVSVKSVDNALVRARRKLKPALRLAA